MGSTPLSIYNRKPNQSPCYQCERRAVYCHSYCEEYKTYSAERFGELSKAKKAYLAERIIADLEIEGKLKTLKRKKWNK